MYVDPRAGWRVMFGLPIFLFFAAITLYTVWEAVRAVLTGRMFSLPNNRSILTLSFEIFLYSVLCLVISWATNVPLLIRAAKEALARPDALGVIWPAASLGAANLVLLAVVVLGLIARTLLLLGRGLLINLHGWARASGTTYVGIWVNVASALLAAIVTYFMSP